jgi:hypothetical protein
VSKVEVNKIKQIHRNWLCGSILIGSLIPTDSVNMNLIKVTEAIKLGCMSNCLIYVMMSVYLSIVVYANAVGNIS